MEVKELRIGNWLKWKDNGQHFDLIIGLFIKPEFLNHIKNGDIVPIPLSPEILEKCGFVKDKEFADLLQHPHLKCRWVTQQLTGDKLDVPFLRFDSTGRPPFICTDVYFLHQLQNIYYALTQNELEIKDLHQ